MKTITLSNSNSLWGFRKRHASSILRHLTFRRFRNLALFAFDLGLRRRKVLSNPLSIRIDPANICNFRCPGCRTGRGDKPEPVGRITYENCKTIIDRTYRDAFKLNLYMWGEPFLHNDIFKMIEYATAKNLSVQLSSNMSVPLASNADAIVDSGLENLIVSVDGASQETYEVYRVGGDYGVVMNNLKSVIEAKRRKGQEFPLIELQFIIFEHNKHEIEVIKETAATLGVDRLTFIDTVKADAARLAEPDKERKKCNWLWLAACFNWDGSFSPCCYSVSDSFGNIFTDSLRQLWNNPKMQKSRSLLTNSPITDGPKTICSTCDKGGGRRSNDSNVSNVVLRGPLWRRRRSKRGVASKEG